MCSYLAQFNKFDPILLINSLHLIHLVLPLPVPLFPSPCSALPVCRLSRYPSWQLLKYLCCPCCNESKCHYIFFGSFNIGPNCLICLKLLPQLLPHTAVPAPAACPIVLAVIIQLAENAATRRTTCKSVINNKQRSRRRSSREWKPFCDSLLFSSYCCLLFMNWGCGRGNSRGNKLISGASAKCCSRKPRVNCGKL